MGVFFFLSLNSPLKEMPYVIFFHHFIPSSAEVAVKLRNRGSDAYKGDVYGDYISVEQKISSDGCRTCKIKNKSGKIFETLKYKIVFTHTYVQCYKHWHPCI